MQFLFSEGGPMIRRFAPCCAALLVLLGFSLPLHADHHEAGEVTKAVEQFYSQMSAGKFADAIGHLAIGSRGYVLEGGLMTIESEEMRQGIVQALEEGRARGAEMLLEPKEIKVTVHGKIAIATYLIDAEFKEPDADRAEAEASRGTLIWNLTDDGWKIVHWHVSNAEEDNEED